MVRTYHINALTQSTDNVFTRTTAFDKLNKSSNCEEPPKRFSQPNRNDTFNNNPSPPIPPPDPPNARQPTLPSPDLSSLLNSPYFDPVGTVIGLRVVYVDGKLSYVPVEPHINFLINQQFGTARPAPVQYGAAMPMMYAAPSWSPIAVPPQQVSPSLHYGYIPGSSPIQHGNEEQQQHQQIQQQRTPQHNYSQPPVGPASRRRNDDEDWFKPTPQPRSGVRRSREWKNEAEYGIVRQVNQYDSRSPSFASMGAMSNSTPSLNNRGLSDAEQHRLELQKQIEDNKRRKEQEKQKEREIEEREMQRHARYLENVRREEEEQRRRERERAQAAERRSYEVHQEQTRRRPTQRRSPPPEVPSHDRNPRPDSSQPRAKEWWERAPTWEKRVEPDRKSAVIPTLRNKPPRTPSAGASSGRGTASRPQSRYDPSASADEHTQETEQRLESRRETRSRGRSASANVYEQQEQYGNQQTDATGRPTAFVIS